ncbi:hypothetical protein [Aquirufa rosea]|uniref:DUF4905 domain-containing protein n=1 Tax=Aquirufa rosea TaxID=2509241 RepID=A0A4Q1C2P3_9BACT|nr:hypothetical protein [Aquirufa rosea]RXK52520.1 hypothetical protein ESB04_02390 [Aquirufa rosea]
MKKKFTYRFDKAIWSLGYWGNPDQPKLWIESKDIESGNWFSYEFQTNELYPMTNSPSHHSHLQWLVGRPTLGIFVRLQSGKNPGIEAIEAYQMSDGKLAYAVPCQMAKIITEEQIFIQQKEGGFYLDLDSGQFSNLKTDKTSVHFQFESPTHIEDSQEQFQAFKQFFHLKFSLEIGKGLDYWEGKDKLIFSYYLYDGAWKNFLLVCDLDFQIILHEFLEEGELMGYHTFQIFQNNLLFIQHKQQLEIYEF